MPAVSTTLGGFLRRLKQSMAAEALGVLSDRELLERVLAAHDETAFQAILCRHGPMVFRVCRRVLHHEQDVEDAFQATFVVLARAARTIRKRGSLASWLHGVAYRAACKARACAARRRECAAPPEGPAQARAADEVSWKELRSVLDEELARLPEKLRAPLVLCYLEGLTQDEAARQLGCSKITCRRNLERARELLGSRLVRRGVTLSAVLLASLLSECAANATVPPTLIASAAQAGAALAAGQEAAAVAVTSGRAVALADGLVQSALAGNWKPLGVLLLAVLLAGVGSAVMTRDAPPAEPPPRTIAGDENTPTATTAPAADRAEEPPNLAPLTECKLPTLILEQKFRRNLASVRSRSARSEKPFRRSTPAIKRISTASARSQPRSRRPTRPSRDRRRRPGPRRR
jgi:RNA polymerase sigma factor (sigma-70 family)